MKLKRYRLVVRIQRRREIRFPDEVFSYPAAKMLRFECQAAAAQQLCTSWLGDRCH